MQLLRNIYLVGGNHFFNTAVEVADCNTYAVRTAQGVVLIDCGYDQTCLETIFENLRYWGMDPSDIRHVLLTHSHFDHTGNARTLRDLGAELWAHSTVAEALSVGDERTIHYAFFRADFPCCEVNHVVSDGDVIGIDEVEFQSLNVPGHTDGNMIYITECDGKKVMFSGDFVFSERPETTEGSLAWNGCTEFDTDKFLHSLLRVQSIRADAVLPGHWGPLMINGSTMIDKALVIALRAWGNQYARRSESRV